MASFSSLHSRRGVLLSALAASIVPPARAATRSLLDVSHDVSREFCKDCDAAFIAHWLANTGETVTVNQSHGGSSKQARSLIDRLEADVITMNQASDIDIDMLHDRADPIPAVWAERLPFNSAPTASVAVILVRAGNPKGIRDWADLAPSAAKALVTRIFAKLPVLDGGGPAATTTFAQRGLGDALVTFESEVPLIEREFGAGLQEIYPSRTILVENPVSVGCEVVDRRGTRALAEAHLKHQYSEAGQATAGRHHLRPRSARVLAAHAKDFPAVNTFTVEDVFGRRKQAQQVHFSDGGRYDQVTAAASVR